MIVQVSFVHHGEGEEAHVSVSFPYYFEHMSGYADNLEEVIMDGINSLVIDLDIKKVIQSGGYTPDRGLYIENYGG